MKANELRINNYVHYNMFQFVIWSITKDCVDLDNEVLDKHLTNIKASALLPIALTEEWLLKFGFEIRIQVESQTYYILNGVEIIWDELDNCFCFKRSLLKFIDIKSSHQLQNLYFALTGKELTIKQ